MLENLNKESFTAQMKTKFLIKREDAPDLTLELHNITGPGTQGRQERFALVFRGPAEPQLEQLLYTVEHEQLGSFDLFLVPVDLKEDGMRYEAVFNRLLE